MLNRLLSYDLPRSRLLAVLLAIIFVCLILTPFIFTGTKSLSIAAKICIFVVLVASYDLLLGYAGIISFAHAMFFGIGAYSVAIALERFGTGFTQLFLGMGSGLVIALLFAALIGFLSLRLRTIFFAMITFAVSNAVSVTVIQSYKLTGGEDGLSYNIPQIFKSSYRFLEEPVFGVAITGKLLLYYVVFVCSLVMFLLLLRIANSPFGSVLRALRENEFRTMAIGYAPVLYRTLASCAAASMAAGAGMLSAVWLRYTGLETTMSVDIAIDILLIVVIGGMGSIYGAVLGTVLVIVAQGYLREILIAIGEFFGGWWMTGLFNPDRWLLWLGLLFVLCVYFFHRGLSAGCVRLKRID